MQAFLCIAWALGANAVDEPNYTNEVVFCIFTVLLGLYIVVFYCLTNNQLRSNLFNKSQNAHVFGPSKW